MLTAEARESFETRGYAHVRGVSFLPPHPQHLRSPPQPPLLLPLQALDAATVEALRSALARLCRPEALLEGESYYHNAAEERGGGDGSQLTTFGDHQLRHSNMQKRDAAFHALIDHASVLPFIEEYMGEPQLAGDWHIRKNIGPRSSWCE